MSLQGKIRTKWATNKAMATAKKIYELAKAAGTWNNVALMKNS